MTVFKAFVKVLNVCKVPVILYTVILIVFGAFSMKTGGAAGNFTQSKPDVLIVDCDQSTLSKGFRDYMRGVCQLTERKESADEGYVTEADREALFYREQNYVIYIPKGFEASFLKGAAGGADSAGGAGRAEKPELEILSTGDYHASYSEMLVNRYINTASAYADAYLAASGVPGIDDTDTEVYSEYVTKETARALSAEAEVRTVSLLDTAGLENAAVYYNFATYSLLAGCVYVICLILSSFRDEKVLKRTVVSSMKQGRFNIQLMLSNAAFAISLWAFYVIMSLLIVGTDVMLTKRGALFVLNSFVFTLCALTLAFLIGNIVTDKNAVSGIVNVVALGTSFLCGAFVPVEWLPGAVLKAAHILPAYWYIQNNEYLKNAETLETGPYITNIAAVCIFCVLFALCAVYVARLKRRKA